MGQHIVYPSVSGASISGYSTEANQTNGNQKTQIVDSTGEIAEIKSLNSGIVATDKGLVVQSIIHGLTSGGGGGYVDVKVNPSGALTVDATITGTPSVTVSSSALPSGASTLAEQQVQTTKLTNIDGKDFATQTTLSALNTKIPSNLTVTSTRLLVDGSGVTQPISGTVTANQGGTWNIGSITNPVDNKERPDGTSTYAPTNATSTAYEASRIIKASAGVLYSIVGYNSKTSSQFIQVHNTTTVPADTSIPVVMFNVPAQSNFSYSADKFGRFFSTGITICNSSTGPTKTIGASDCWFDVQFS